MQSIKLSFWCFISIRKAKLYKYFQLFREDSQIQYNIIFNFFYLLT